MMMTRRTFAGAVLCGPMASTPALPSGASTGTETETAWKAIETLGHSDNPRHRKYAAAAFALIAGRYSRALKQVGDLLLSDREAEVRAFTASALGQEKSRAAIPKLRQALDDSAATVAFAAAKALWDMRDHSGAVIFREVLTGARKDSVGLIDGYMAEARHMMHDPKALAMMGVKEATSAFLGPASMAISFAEETMKDKGATGRAFAASALADDHSANTRRALRIGLEDSNPIVRAAACRSLAILNDRNSLGAIEPLLNDKDDATQAIASAVYIRLHTARPKRKGK
jgi:HEAT repeat protein